MAGLISPIRDTEQENIERQMAYADALRKQSMQTGGQMVGRVYVAKNPWQNFVEGLAGGGIGEFQRLKQQGLEESRKAQREQFLAQMPQASRMTPTPELDEQGNPVMADTPRDAREYARDMRNWATQAAGIPGMEGVGAYGLQQAMLAPEQQANREEAGRQRAFEITARAEEARRLQGERLDAQRVRDEESRQLKLTLAQMAAAARQGSASKPDMRFVDTVDEQGNPIKMAVDMSSVKPGQVMGKFVAPPKPSAAEQKATAEARIGIANIDDAIAKVNDPKAKDAFGLVNLTPGAETFRQYTNPEGVDARAAVSNIGSLKLHDRSGAAVTAAEFPRLRPFIPNQFDKPEVIVKKLNNMKAEYQRIQDEWSSGRNTSSNGGTPSLARAPVNRPGAAPAAAPDAEYEAWKKANGLQ